jgi:hypothetical protein
MKPLRLLAIGVVIVACSGGLTQAQGQAPDAARQQCAHRARAEMGTELVGGGVAIASFDARGKPIIRPDVASSAASA